MSSKRARGVTIVFRADSSRTIGHGHLSRSLAIASKLVEAGAKVELLSVDIDDVSLSRAQSSGVVVRRINCGIGSEEDSQSLIGLHADLCVLDGYDFDDSYFGRLDQAEVKYAIIDDFAARLPQRTQLVINPNANASQSLYPSFQPFQVLAGSQFSLIRKEIVCSRLDLNEDRSSIPRVLIAIGATDIAELNCEIAGRLLSEFESSIEVVVSGEEGCESAKATGEDIAPYLATASLAIIGAGVTTWEAAFLGVPTIALVIAENQLLTSQAAAGQGISLAYDCRAGVDFEIIVSLVKGLLGDHRLLKQMSRLGVNLIDGLGAKRVAEAILASVLN